MVTEAFSLIYDKNGVTVLTLKKNLDAGQFEKERDIYVFTFCINCYILIKF